MQYIIFYSHCWLTGHKVDSLKIIMYFVNANINFKIDGSAGI